MTNEFYKNIKMKKTLLIIGTIIFTVCIIIGMIIYNVESNVKYTKLDKSANTESYSKISVQYLDSYFATQEVDGTTKKYYIAIDEDNNPYIVMLNNEYEEKLRKIQEYTLSNDNIEKPEPITIYGHTSKMQTELYTLLQDWLKDDEGNTFTIDELKSNVGQFYLDTSWKASQQALYAFIVFASFSLIGLILIIIYLVRNKKTKHFLKEYEYELKKVEKEIDNGKVIYNKLCKVYLTDKYIISYSNGLNIIEIKNIVWIYPQEINQRGITTTKTLYAVTNKGKSNIITQTTAFGKSKIAFDELYQDIINKIPDVLFGYTSENKKQAKNLYIK